MNNSINTIEGMNSIVWDIEECARNLEDKRKEIAQSEQQKEKQNNNNNKMTTVYTWHYQVYKHLYYRSPRRRENNWKYIR